MAERGQLLALKCEMPQCYHHKGRGGFDPVGTPGDRWTPSRDHYPILKSDGGKFVAENVRLSHSWCNKRDYGGGRRSGRIAREGQVPRRHRRDAEPQGSSPAHTARTDGRPPWCARPTCPSPGSALGGACEKQKCRARRSGARAFICRMACHQCPRAPLSEPKRQSPIGYSATLDASATGPLESMVRLDWLGATSSSMRRICRGARSHGLRQCGRKRMEWNRNKRRVDHDAEGEQLNYLFEKKGGLAELGKETCRLIDSEGAETDDVNSSPTCEPRSRKSSLQKNSSTRLPVAVS